MIRVKRWKKAWLWYLLPVLFTLMMQYAGAPRPVERFLKDHLYQDGSRVSPKIYVIGIDEDTLAYYGTFYRWGREKIAEMVRYLTKDEKDKPAVIAIDVGFYGEKEEEADQELVSAVRDAGNVVLVSAATFGTDFQENANGTFFGENRVILFDEPFRALKDAAAAVGHSNTQTDSDGMVRKAVGSLFYEGKEYPSFAYQIYRQYTGRDDRDFARDEKGFYIRYTGKPYDYYGAAGAGCSFRKVLEGKYPTAAFAGNIVLIGSYASGMQDHYFTSIDHGTPMNGVEIQANILQQIMDNVHVRMMPREVGMIVTAIAAAIVVLILILTGNRVSVSLTAFLMVVYVAMIRTLYSEWRILSPVVYVPFMMVLLLITHIVLQYFTVYREKKKIVSSYGRYLSPAIAEAIAGDEEVKLSIGGQKKDIAVLFVDIRNFTTLSEEFRPETVVEMLNRCLEITTDAIFRNHGTVDKFIGDATMGVFNAPLDLNDYTYRAVLAGLDMARNAESLKNELAPQMRDRVGFGIGINCGEAIVGNIGTDFRMEYTAIGDTVNIASRLEGKAGSGEVIISQSVYDRVHERILCQDRGMVRLKGKAEPVHIYRALGVRDDCFPDKVNL